MPGSLIGRDDVSERLHRLIDSSAAGEGSGLLLTGPAGIGKSALLRHAADHAMDTGALVLRAEGVPTEYGFGYAVLGQLLRPVAAEAAEAAVLAEVLRNGESPATAHAVGLAVLDVITTLAERAPVVVVVDDLHWADSSSAVVLSFLARRIGSDAVAFIGAYRDDVDGEPAVARAGLPRLAVAPLSATDAEQLLRGFAPDLPAAARRRVVRQAAGNPLALAELARTTTWPRTAPDELALTDRLQRTFAERAQALPPAVRLCLLVAALGDGDLTEVLTVATTVIGAPVGVADLEPAMAARLIESLGQLRQLRFRHPLIRSAIRQAATHEERRVCHRALADVTVDRPERQAWHRAAATEQPDEVVAANLEATAKAALGRGEVQAGHGMLLIAADLSPEPGRRHQRLMAAMVAATDLGDVPEIARLIGVIDTRLLDLSSRLVVGLHAELYVGSGWNSAHTIIGEVGTTELLSETDLQEVVANVYALSLRTYWATDSGDPLRTTLLNLVDRAPADDPERTVVDALVAPVERGASALHRLRALDTSTADPTLLANAGHAAEAVGDLSLSSRLLSTASTGLRTASALGALTHSLVGQSLAAVLLGDARLAAMYADEAALLAAETSQRFYGAAASALGAAAAGLRGDNAASQALTADAEQVLIPAGATPMLALVRLARGITALGQGRPAEAFDELHAVFRPGAAGFHFAFRLLLVQPLAEAAMRSGHDEALRALVHELSPVAVRTGSPALTIGLRYAGALLASDEAADAVFRDALNSIDLTGFDRAQLQLAYGQSLRRRRQSLASRTHLRASLRTYESLGMIPWAEMARAQLRATGEQVDVPSTDAADLLTPQELHIAALAAQGLSNRDIAQRLYVSHRTIGSHLYHIFPKLGVTSRAELAQVLGPAVASFPA